MRCGSRLFHLLLTVLLVALVPPAGAQAAADAALFEGFRAADMRLADAGFRLSTANAALCDRLEPGHGIQVHSLDQYASGLRPAVAAHFRFAGALAVEGVVADGPAARAGIRADDTIVRFGGIAVAPPGDGPPSTDRLVGFWTAVAALPPTAPIRAELLRDGAPVTVTIQPVAACRTRYELAITSALEASANGEMVRISSGYYDSFGPELVVVAIAHELAHNILQHRERLKAAGAQFGVLSGFGRNADLFRQTELQADTLAVHLLARAGYPANLASRFRQHPVAKAQSGMFQARSHPHWRDRLRVALVEEARIAAAGPGAPFVVERGTPLTGNWRPLVPKD
ncbi:peptidase M48 family protein [Sphingomonas sp.]|uniref:peptidase M48 family protein n=1 Tax=Sphingomonas sp. TaxID=28214 RepID=UPI003BAC72F6